MRTRTLAVFGALALLAACNTKPEAPAVKSTTTAVAGPTTTVLVGQFCDDVATGQESTTPTGQKVRCEFNDKSKRNQWVEIKDSGATTTISPVTTTTTTEPPPPPTTVPPEPGGADDPYGPILCSGLHHPAHHSPCPAKTTATTASLPRTVSVGSPQRIAAVSPSGGSGRCGGDLPSCSVMQRESGGDPTAIGYGECSGRDCQGKWQIDPNTAASVGYPRNLASQPESVQDNAARAILARDGCGAWSTC